MPKNEVAVWDPAQVPAHIAAQREAGLESNLTNRGSVNRISIRGKVFTVNVDGEKEILMVATNDGDQVPRQMIPTVILNSAARRSRTYYPDGYSEKETKQPTCWSPDGVKPSPNSAEIQSPKCATCQWSAKGSKVSEDGFEGRACAEHRFLAVQFFKKWDFPPLSLRISITSDYDTRNKAQNDLGWYAYGQYQEWLKARGIVHTSEVVTRIKFDPAASTPKLLFQAAGYLDEEQAAIIAKLRDDPIVESYIHPTFEAAAPADDTPSEDADQDGPVVTQGKAGKAAAGKAATPPAGKTTTGKPAARKPAAPPVEEPAEEEQGEEAEAGAEEGEGVEELVEGAEAEEELTAEEQAALIAEAVAKKAAEKKAAAAKTAGAAAAAKKAAAAAPDETIVVAPPKAPAGKTTTGAAGKNAAPKGTPAGKPAVTTAVNEIIDEW